MVFPTAVTFDAAGNMYVAEAGSIHIAAFGELFGGAAGGGLIKGAFGDLPIPRLPGRVRKVTPEGAISTIAGPGARYFPDDLGDNALILPMALAVAPDGRLAIADLGANAIRILPAGSY